MVSDKGRKALRERYVRDVDYLITGPFAYVGDAPGVWFGHCLHCDEFTHACTYTTGKTFSESECVNRVLDHIGGKHDDAPGT
jgi:hypothetical protein